MAWQNTLAGKRYAVSDGPCGFLADSYYHVNFAVVLASENIRRAAMSGYCNDNYRPSRKIEALVRDQNVQNVGNLGVISCISTDASSEYRNCINFEVMLGHSHMYIPDSAAQGASVPRGNRPAWICEAVKTM